MINRIKIAVNFIANNEVQGNITPTEFNIALNNSILSIYGSYFLELNNLLAMEAKGHIFNGLSDLSSRTRERIQYYLESKSVSGVRVSNTSPPTFKLPEDCRFLDSVTLSDGSASLIDFATNPSEYRMIQNYKHTKPTKHHPSGLLTGRSFVLYPDDIESVVVYYLRNPKRANWTYIVPPGSSVELFNPSDPLFENVDMHVSEEANLILRVLTQFGINLKDMDLLQSAQLYAEQESESRTI